jgi:hypothetical protein
MSLPWANRKRQKPQGASMTLGKATTEDEKKTKVRKGGGGGEEER